MSSQKNPEPETFDTQMEPNGTQDRERASTDIPSPEAGSTSVDVVAIPADRSGAFWPVAKPYLMQAFDRFPGEMTEDELLTRLAKGEFVLWLAWGDEIKGAAVTQIATYPEFEALRIVGLGGDEFEAWREEADRIFEKFCRFHGLTRIEFYGRRGWEKRLPNYTLNRIVMVRNI